MDNNTTASKNKKGIPRKLDDVDEKDKDLVTLSLSPRSGNETDLFSDSQKPQSPPPPPPLQEDQELGLRSPMMQSLLPSPPLQEDQELGLRSPMMQSLLPSPPHPLQLPPNHSILNNVNRYAVEPQSTPSPIPPPPLPLPEPFSVHLVPPPLAQQAPAIRTSRCRRNNTQTLRDGKSETVPPPFPWATSFRATVHSYSYLVAREIYAISGEVQCKRCDRVFQIAYDLREKFPEVANFIAANKCAMHDRAPPVLMNPALPKCDFCDQDNSVKPLISEKKKSINWLFLLLGQMLGCCTLEQLKYFCKHTKNHRTGAKDRVLYLTYLGLCKQLNPEGPFDR